MSLDQLVPLRVYLGRPPERGDWEYLLRVDDRRWLKRAEGASF